MIAARTMPPSNEYGIRKKPKSIPKFASEADERRFWETHDSSDHIDWRKAERVPWLAEKTGNG